MFEYIYVISLISLIFLSFIWYKKYSLDNKNKFLEENSKLLNDNTKLKVSLEEKEKSLEEEKEKNFKLLNEKNAFLRENEGLSVRLEEKEKNLRELKEAKELLKMEFEALANKIFEEKNKKFNEENTNKLDNILNPFKENINEFKKKVEKNYEESSKDGAMLRKEIEILRTLNNEINKEASKLTKALKGDNKILGDWGEIVLERVLESSGLSKGREYEIQGTFKDEEGRNLRPDVIIHLPNDKHIVIDSKLSLKSYEAYMNASNKEEEENAFSSFKNSIKKHIKDLSSKDYTNLYGLNSLDFLLMFLPIEGSFTLLSKAGDDIFREAFSRNIVLVSPSTLFMSLKTIENIWKFERRNKNAEEIAKEAGLLYDKFNGFIGDMEKVSKYIKNTQEAHDLAFNKLSNGRGNLVSKVEKLKNLGANTSKKIGLSYSEE